MHFNIHAPQTVKLTDLDGRLEKLSRMVICHFKVIRQRMFCNFFCYRFSLQAQLIPPFPTGTGLVNSTGSRVGCLTGFLGFHHLISICCRVNYNSIQALANISLWVCDNHKHVDSIFWLCQCLWSYTFWIIATSSRCSIWLPFVEKFDKSRTRGPCRVGCFHH